MHCYSFSECAFRIVDYLTTLVYGSSTGMRDILNSRWFLVVCFAWRSAEVTVRGSKRQSAQRPAQVMVGNLADLAALQEGLKGRKHRNYQEKIKNVTW